MYKWHVFTEVFNPSRGMMRVFLCDVYADTLAEAKRLARREVERGEVVIVEVA